MTNVTATEIPGYTAGTWNIDPTHSDVSFIVRHMMVSKVRGHFEKFSGQIVTAEDPSESTVSAVVDATSFNTRNVDRDNHIRSADFLEVDKYPTLEFRSTGLRAHGGGEYALDGELTVHGVTRPVPFQLELNGFTKDPFGGTAPVFRPQPTSAAASSASATSTSRWRVAAWSSATRSK